MKNNEIKKAMLLAAGFGTRLRPLTLTTPKPLLPLNGKLLIDHQLNYLSNAGIEEVVINLHHLGDKIKKHVGTGARYNLTIIYSEEESILGTGGGIKKAFGDEVSHPFIVLNSDALINVNIKNLVEFHFQNKSSTTLVLKKLTGQEKFNPVNIDKNGFVKSFGTGTHFYTGLQILSSSILEVLPPKETPSCLVRDGYLKLLEKGEKISAFIYDGYFNDTGTAERYKQAKKDIKEGIFKLIGA